MEGQDALQIIDLSVSHTDPLGASVTSSGRVESPIASQRLKMSTPRNIKRGTVESIKYGCAYPQSSSVNVPCVPECIQGMKLHDTAVCTTAVYVVDKNGTLSKINEGSKNGAHVYLHNKSSTLSDKHISKLHKEGVTKYVLFTSNESNIAYGRVGTHGTASSATTKGTGGTASGATAKGTGGTSGTTTKGTGGTSGTTDCAVPIDEDTKTYSSSSSSRGKSVSFSPEVVDNQGKTAKVRKEVREEDCEDEEWPWMAMIVAIVLLFFILAAAVYYFFYYSVVTARTTARTSVITDNERTYATTGTYAH